MDLKDKAAENIYEEIHESQEKVEKKLNLVVKFLAEDDSTDEGKVHLMMNILSLDMTKVSEVRRVDEAAPGKMRPLWLKFVDAEVHSNLLKDAKQLRVLIRKKALKVNADDDELVLLQIKHIIFTPYLILWNK